MKRAISKTTWSEIRTAYASGIGLREIARNMKIPEGTVPNTRLSKQSDKPGVKYWEIIADTLSKAGWSWGCVSAVDSHGRTIFVADAHRGDNQLFFVRADEKLTAFMEIESAIRAVS